MPWHELVKDDMILRSLFEEHFANQGLCGLSSLEFDLPPELEADAPPEARGFERDEVRLMVSYRSDDRVVHSTFRDLPDFLEAGDVLAINTSGTMNAAIGTWREDGTALELHLSTRLPANLWVVEVRRPTETATEPFRRATVGETLRLPGGATATLHAPYPGDARGEGSRLWVSTLDLPEALDEYLGRHGRPIRYEYVRESWPASYYQTVYATETGSAEMPSAGRAFTPELITHLVAKGVQVAPLILHTGVASLEDDEPSYEEFYRVPPDTARLINAAHAAGKRVVAVGTTVVRALETVADPDGVTHPGEGWTSLVITPERGIRTVGAMLTGLHEPRSTHLAMLEALAERAPKGSGQEHLKVAYAEALREGYLWHEFGDLHLILP
ncbi:S-adenosylmethionine:tRNA ribosyltransferase-isomerase [soil metagenome]